jgi:hypothetical protein
MFRCPACGGRVKKCTVIIRLSDVDGSNCVSCDSFYDRKEIKKAILTP